jgi:excisionase family DNA binding protein
VSSNMPTQHRVYPRTVRLQSLAASMASAKQEIAGVLAMPMISVPEFSEAMGVSIATSRRWLKDGTIKGFRSGRSWWKIPVSEVKRMKGLV